MPRKFVASIGVALLGSALVGCLLPTLCFALYRLH